MKILILEKRRMNLFGKKKTSTSLAVGPPPVDAIKELRNQLVILEKRENLMQQRITTATQDAIKKKSSNDTKGALFELKRKKMFEEEVRKLQGARITLDSQIMALESAAINMETVKAMKTGADAMKNIHGNMDADKVDDLLESIQEQKEIHDTIAEAVARPGQEMFDDEELLNELAELDALDSQPVLTTPAATDIRPIHLPVVPSNAVNLKTVKQETDEEREIRELEASMLA